MLSSKREVIQALDILYLVYWIAKSAEVSGWDGGRAWCWGMWWLLWPDAGVMWEDGACWPGQVLSCALCARCVPGAHIVMSPISSIHQPAQAHTVLSCVCVPEFLHQTTLRVPGLPSPHPDLQLCPAPDTIYAFLQQAQPGQHRSKATKYQSMREIHTGTMLYWRKTAVINQFQTDYVFTFA